AWVGKPVPFHRSNVKRRASRTPGPKSSRCASMSATSHPDLKLCTAHSCAVSWIIRTICSCSSLLRPAVAKATTSCITSAGFAASCTSVWARIAISSPKTVATSWAWPVQPTYLRSATQYTSSRTPLSNPAASHIHDASRHDRSCDSSGWPNALSCASARVATNSPKRSGFVKIGNSPDAGPERLEYYWYSIDHLLPMVVKQKVHLRNPKLNRCGYAASNNVSTDLPLLLREINTNNLWVPHPRHVFVFVARVGSTKTVFICWIYSAFFTLTFTLTV